MEVSRMIFDLAIMLGVGAFITILFKKLHIPVVLGYIVAGLLIGPYFPLFLTVKSMPSIETWGQIGLIILMFHIGLEFDFTKIRNLGPTPISQAVIKTSGTFIVGYILGRIMTLSQINSVFLGAMLAITSTIVVKKCFEEKIISNEKLEPILTGSLIIEDILAVIIMIILNAVARTQGLSFKHTLIDLGIMFAFLVVWIIIGIFAVPTIVDKLMKYLNGEMLTIFAIGFCFVMAVLSHLIGFSTGLGGFVAGSLLAGTSCKSKIVEATLGVKDIFGAVFFLFVGMQIVPNVVLSEWKFIILIAVIAMIAKLIFSMLGMILAGQDIETSIKAGIAMGPIGEFSFVIASLGISLELMSEKLYPIIVAASVLTIIASPLLMHFADPITAFIEGLIPDKLTAKLNDYTSKMQTKNENGKEWKLVLNDYLKRILIYGSLIFVASFAGCKFFEPWLETVMPARFAKVLAIISILLITAIFAWPMLKFNNANFTYLWINRRANRMPLTCLIFSKFLILIALVGYPIISLFHIEPLIGLILIAAAILLLTRTDFIPDYYLQLENKFIANLSHKTVSSATNRKHWLSEDYNIFSFIVPSASSFTGKSIGKLNWGKYQKVYVAKIKRAKKSLVVPGPRVTLQGGDKVYVIGDDSSLKTFHKTLGLGRIDEVRTLKEFLQGSDPDKNHLLACLAVPVTGEENYAGKTIKHSGIMRDNHTLILGIEKKGRQTILPDPNTRIAIGDILWVIGSEKNLKAIGSRTVGERG